MISFFLLSLKFQIHFASLSLTKSSFAMATIIQCKHSNMMPPFPPPSKYSATKMLISVTSLVH